ncbi:hypothetical protein GGH13_001003 [Coemansia sp. S155-1]|nr:hypothetical protein GGH13_001003 [Coemansia sp. S155-1]
MELRVTCAIVQHTYPRDQPNGLPDDNHNTTYVADVLDLRHPYDMPLVENRPSVKMHDSATLKVSGKAYIWLWKKAMKRLYKHQSITIQGWKYCSHFSICFLLYIRIFTFLLTMLTK